MAPSSSKIAVLSRALWVPARAHRPYRPRCARPPILRASPALLAQCELHGRRRAYGA